MATSSVLEEKWGHSTSTQDEECQAQEEEEEEEEEEALSLCDLPVNLVKGENNQSSIDQEAHQETETNQEEFDFGPFRGGDGSLLSNKSADMCAADDIFFQGQILPLRHSVSSETGVNKLKNDSSLNPTQCLSRSESMDHNSLGAFTSFSSRSSSCRSHYSSSCSSSSTIRMMKPMSTQNQFLITHPSPKPQIRVSSTSLGNAASNKRPRNSSVWDFFRLGLVRTPEIELQDLKFRNSVSRNSSSSSTNSNSSINKYCTKTDFSGDSSRHNSNEDGKNMEKQSLLEKRGGLFSGCSCSVSAVKPVPLNNNTVVMKSSNSRRKSGSRAGNGNNDHKSHQRGSVDELEEKLQELKMKKKRMVEKQKQQKQQQGKQAMSRHRTFEWIKELSHATYLDS